MWEGRPWTPEEIPGIDPEYTWGFPNPETHTYKRNPEYYNHMKMTRGLRIGMKDGNFMWTNQSGQRPPDESFDWGYTAEDYVSQCLDSEWGIVVYAQEFPYDLYGEGEAWARRAILVRKEGIDLFLEDMVDIGPSRMPGEFDTNCIIAKLTDTRVVVQYMRRIPGTDNYDENGTPTLAILERVGNTLQLVSTHHVDAVHETEQPGPNWFGTWNFYGSIAVLSPNKIVVSYKGGQENWTYTGTGQYAYSQPRLAVVSISDAGVMISQGHSLSLAVGATVNQSGSPGQSFLLDEYGAVSLCALNENQIAYCVGVNQTVEGQLPNQFNNLIAWYRWGIGRATVDGMNLIFDSEPLHDIDFYVAANTGSQLPPGHDPNNPNHVVNQYHTTGAEDYVPPEIVRISDTKVVVAYTRQGGVSPRYWVYYDGSVVPKPTVIPGTHDTFVAPSNGLTYSDRVYGAPVPTMRVIEFVGDTIVRKAQHFLNIAYPTYRFPDSYTPEHYYNTLEAWGTARPWLVDIGNGKILAINYDDSFNYPGLLFNPNGTQGDIARDYIENIHGVAPDNDWGWDWSIVELDDSSPSGLRSEGASFPYIFGQYPAISESGRPSSFGDGTFLMGQHYGAQRAPTHPEYYDLQDERQAVYESIVDANWLQAHPWEDEIEYEDGSGKVAVANPPQWEYLFNGFFWTDENGGFHFENNVLPAPEYSVESDFWEWDSWSGFLQFGYDENSTAIPWDDAVAHAWVISLKGRGKALAGDPSQRVNENIKPKPGL